MHVCCWRICLKYFFNICQVGLRKEAWQHQRGEREGATEAQVQEGVQGRSEGDQEGHALPRQREAQRGHEQVRIKRSVHVEVNQNFKFKDLYLSPRGNWFCRNNNNNNSSSHKTIYSIYTTPHTKKST